jgi:hypothetical protein
LLAEHGDADTSIPYSAGAGTFASASPPKFFLTLIGERTRLRIAVRPILHRQRLRT